MPVPPTPAPQALSGVRIADLSWLLASAGTTTTLASLGAEVIRIEWPDKLDFTRFDASGAAPLAPGRQPHEYKPGLALEPNPNRSGVFNDRNPGKQSITLNMNAPEGRELFKQLVAVSDVVVEGFTAPTMTKWGLGYEELCKVNPSIIYLQMAGFGNSGPYRDHVSMGPAAQAMAGVAFANGLPERPPTMWNHSYMDTTPPHYGALAVIAALYFRNRTGRGQYIDQAQYEPGLMLTGTSVLDHSVNGRPTQRLGNRSPSKPAAPHGIFRCRGRDGWVAIACFTEDQWSALVRTMGDPGWAREPRFAALRYRLANQDELDQLVEEWTRAHTKYDVMYELQAVGVPAGAVQSPRDKFESDPQLQAREFFVELDHTEMGPRPFTRHFTPKLSASPAHPGGSTGHGAPCVGEHNSLFESLLGLTPGEIADLGERGVI